MVSDNVCAILANRVYNRATVNRGPIPDGWVEVPDFYVPDNGDGFSAGAYRNTATNEIVIAYTGTNAANDWTQANFPAGFGMPSDQVERAIEFYSDVAATYGNAVTFTGHSLGGGLASLMTAYFGQRAVVFDPAPFRPSALNIETVEDYYQHYLDYQDEHDERPTNAAFTAYSNGFEGSTNVELVARKPLLLTRPPNSA